MNNIILTTNIVIQKQHISDKPRDKNSDKQYNGNEYYYI